MSGATAGWVEDEPLYLTCDGVDLFAIYTPPAGEPNGVGVHLIAGGGVHASAGRSRSRFHMARHLSGRGFGVLRTDHPGTGESGGEFAEVDFEAPLVAEACEAVAYLRSQHQKVVVVANCFGGRNVIHAADQLGRLDAVVLVAPPLEDRDHSQATLHHRSLGEWARRGIDPRRWPRFLGHARNGYVRILARRARHELLRAVGRAPVAEPGRRAVIPTLGRWLDQGVPILLLSSEQEDFHKDLLIAMEGALGELVARHSDLLDVVFADTQLSTGSSQAAQLEARQKVTEWLERRFADAP